MFSVFALLVATVVGTSDAQALAATSNPGPQGQVARSSEAPPSVTLVLNNVSRDSAIRAVVEAVGFELVYSKQFVKLNGQVTARFSKTPLMEAISTVLRGSGIISRVSMTSKSVFLAPDTTQKKQDTVSSAKPARLRGRVVDSVTRQGIEGATIELQGTPKAFITDAGGQFHLGEIAAGKYVLTARRLGYAAVTHTVKLEADQDTTIVMMLASTSTALTTVVTTGSGDRKKYQVGNSIATIDANEVVASELIRNISDLLANRANGLQVFRSTGAVGSPSRLRVRGISSIQASNAPIIMLDGVRISGDYTQTRDQSLPGAFASPSRLDDIDPDIIESIEVLKGPAASTLFGSDAANGVIVIKTKRGIAGPARWNLRFDRGLTYQPKDYPFPIQRLGYPLTGGKSTTCSLQEEAEGRCVSIDSTIGTNLLANEATTSLARGGNTTVGINVSGGVPTLQYFLSGGYTNELGTSKLPNINARLIRASLGGDELPGWMKRPNEQTKKDASGRLTGQFGKASDFSLSANFIQLDHRNGPDGMSGLLSDVRGPGDSIRIVPGWETFNFERTQHLTRVLGNATGNLRPFEWLSGNLVYGWDFSLRDSRELNRRNSCLPLCTVDDQASKGAIYSGRYSILVQSVSLGTTATRPLGSRFTLRSAVGGQYVRDKSRDVFASATDLAEGATSIDRVNGIAVAEEIGGETAIAGLYLDESLALNDRLFLSAAIRRDVSSALGASVAPLYPKWGLSWVASQEPFFPWKDLVSLRLRAAFGHAGVQPDGSVKLRNYGRLNDFVTDDGIAIGNYASIFGVGNLDLRPERSVEHEGGFELGFLRDRVLLDLTVFRKFTRDAIVSRPLAPSIDFGVQSQNIGNVLNTGTEASLSLRMVERSEVSWNLNLGYASRRNKLVTLGKGVDPFTSGGFNDASRVIEGYPLFSRWARPIVGYEDRDGDGVIIADEIRVGDSLTYIGPSGSKYDLSIMNSVGFLQDRIRLNANFQYVNGLVQFNQFRSQNWMQLGMVQVPGAASLKEQAYVIASMVRPNSTDYGFFETTDFLRFNELSMSYTAPKSFARRLRANSAIFSVLATNLGIWTNYNGRDPDVNTASAAGNQYFNGAAFPQPRNWSFRVNLTF